MICPNCGKEASETVPFCEFCGTTLPKQQEDCAFEGEHEHQQELVNEPKPLMGFLGALLGAVLAGAIIVLLPRLGLMPAYGGVVIAFFIFMGYWLMNKSMTKIGFGVCIMFVIFTPYIADRVNWSLWMMSNVKELEGITLLEAFLGMPIMLDAGEIEPTAYYVELFKLYIFTAAGAVAYLAGVAKARKKKEKQPL